MCSNCVADELWEEKVALDKALDDIEGMVDLADGETWDDPYSILESIQMRLIELTKSGVRW